MPPGQHAQRDAGRTLWNTPRVLTFMQFAEGTLQAQWADANVPDRLLPAGRGVGRDP